MLIRIFDISISFLALLFLSPLIILIYCIVFFDNKSPFFFQERVGKDIKKFNLIKFRTMLPGTNSCATHLVDPSRVTFTGNFLRKSKLDEIPQLWNVLIGEMSLVGPRPCLFTQIELIKKRKEYNLHKVKPGITGLAQIKGIDMSEPSYLVNTEHKMITNFNLVSYFIYIFLTLIGLGFGDRTNKK